MIAIFSDIHANLYALQAVLADMPQVQAVWVLGDSIGELPFPCETLDTLAQLEKQVPVFYAAGNRELDFMRARNGEMRHWWQGTQFRSMAWTFAQLQPRHWNMLSRMQHPATAPLPNGREALLFHGTPNKVRGVIRTQEDAGAVFAASTQAVLAGGHTHNAFCCAANGRLYLNPGSVGISLDGTGGVASYALLEENTLQVQHKSIPYDMQAAALALQSSELFALSPCIVQALVLEIVHGRQFMMPLIAYTAAYAKEKYGMQRSPLPPEIWKEAAEHWVSENEL